jgi:hypothetical protein
MPKAAGAATPAKPKRWQVLLPGLIRGGRAVFALLVIVAMLAYGAVPPFRNAVNGQVSRIETSVKEMVMPTFDPVRPAGATASSQTAAHPASAAVDLYKNTFWSADLRQDREPALTLSFAQPADVDVLLITPGDTGNFTAEARPKDVHVVLSNGRSQDLSLEDNATPQRFDIDNAHGILRMEIHIRSVYTSAQSTAVAVTEVEPFSRH